ncbi:YceI family protein [Nitrospira sp. NS4]|uniref:YceI family protein n=1 Tax=Nitrospira sp. NS4 TaxID=3414498 RepID=UPI003C2CC692
MRRRAIWGVSLLIGVLAVSLPVGARAEMARWDLDPDHSIIEFRVAHMVVSKTAGRFMDYSGVVEMDADAHRFKTIEATINTASVNTNHEKRDAHLRNVDFFDVEKYPAMTYKLKSYKKTDEGYQALGDLTLRGVTKEITLAGTFNGVTKDPWGNTRAGFTGEGTINRKDFGMVWNKTLDSGGLVVGDEVQIRLDIECIKAKKP